MPEILYLEHAGINIPVRIEQITASTSPHTRRELIELQGEVHASEEERHTWFLELLRNQPDEGISSLATEDMSTRQWKIKLRSWTKSTSRYSYNVQLTEKEKLNIQALILDDVEIHPYKYEEEHEERLRISGKVQLSSHLMERFVELWTNGNYFTVVRRGIDEEPKQMRFGAVYWSQHPDGNKYDFVLVEKTPEEETPRWPLDLPELNMRAQLAFEVAMRKELYALLQQKGILTDEEIESLRQNAQAKLPEIENEFFRAKDIDAWP